MPALSCRRLVFLALTFVTVVSAAGPTPTSAEEPDLFPREENGGGPYGLRYGNGPGMYNNAGGNNDGSGWENNGWGNGNGNGNSGSNYGGGNNNQGGNNNGGNDQGYPTPSQRPRQRAVRRLTSLSPSELAGAICPFQLTACPIAEAGTLSAIPTSVSEWTEQGFECVDVRADLRACGGCPSLDSKHDCTSIEGANDIACVAGQCVVDSCRTGYTLDSDKSTCHRN